MKKRTISLKWGLLAFILLCWAAAVFIVVYAAGILINYNFDRTLDQTVRRDSEQILSQISMRFTDSMEASKEISYDGTVRSAYRQYCSDSDSISLYRQITEYLSSSFSRDAKFRAVFISFWDPDITSRMYVINEKRNSYQILQQYLTQVRPRVLENMADADTQIRFQVYDGDLYMCRNLLDSSFRPYATVSMLCETQVLLQALQPVQPFGYTILQLDGCPLIYEDGKLSEWSESRPIPQGAEQFGCSIDGHELSFYVARTRFDIVRDLPGLRTAVLAALTAVLPILAVMIFLFYKMVTEPMEKLVEASRRIASGERGYQLNMVPNNREFRVLYGQFNAMSAELKQQFDRSRLEQQALQQAKIKALQSQINPHFLNNTLEVINWEARIAGNDNVSEMIDALSTMLDASLDRDGSGTVCLKREVEYAEAYLHIIQRRLGSRFRFSCRVDESLLEVFVPKLILQPIVENAVEHDITPRKGGQLDIRIGAQEDLLVMEVFHEGIMTEEDRDKITRILTDSERPGLQRKDRHVGLRNVAMRLQLLYGGASSFTMEQTGPEMIRARICLPRKSST